MVFKSVVSICGASGSGKSSTAKAVVEILPDCERIPTDYFIVPNAGSEKEYFERPLEYDWQLFNESVAAEIGCEMTTPDFDFVRFERRSLQGGRRFQIKRILITDGFYPHPSAAIRILLESDDTTRMRRIAARDREWQTEVVQRWLQLEATHNRLRRDFNDWDLKLDGTKSLMENASQIAALLISRANTMRPIAMNG